MMRSVVALLLGIAAMLCVAELVCRVLPVSGATFMGYYIDPAIRTYPANHRWSISTGWDLRNSRQLRANNLGFVADKDFVADSQAIGLVGDSYVEAAMLDAGERPAARLEAGLAVHRPVYALGGPGSALLDYAERIRFAKQQLGLNDFVVLMEPGDLRQSLCGSGNVHAACLDPQTFAPEIRTIAGPTTAKRVLRHSALAQYFSGQLKLTWPTISRQFFGLVATSPGVLPAPPISASRQTVMVRAVAEEFFARIRPLGISSLTFVVDGRHDQRAYAGAAIPPPAGPLLERDAFVALARERGFTVVDAQPFYRQHWAQSKLSLSVSPQDDHLNALGVDLLMRATARAMP